MPDSPAGHSPESFRGAEVLFDFTVGEAVVGNVRAAISGGVRRFVIGTTNWASDRDAVERLLTDAGAELARHARLIAQQVAAAAAALAAIRGVRGGHLSIGVVSTAKYFAPRLLAQFRARHPGIELTLAVHNREEIVRLLADNQIDFAIMGRAPQQSRSLTHMATRSMPMVSCRSR